MKQETGYSDERNPFVLGSSLDQAPVDPRLDINTLLEQWTSFVDSSDLDRLMQPSQDNNSSNSNLCDAPEVFVSQSSPQQQRQQQRRHSSDLREQQDQLNFAATQECDAMAKRFVD